MRDYSDPDALPTHYRANGQVCDWSGVVVDGGRCPRGCDHADHYANDGHEACADEDGEEA